MIDTACKDLSLKALTLEELKDRVQQKYSRIRKSNKTGTSNKALIAILTDLVQNDAAFAAFVQQFKGSCRAC
eukprot:679874-Ditylum_brightwellii.AAC.1